MGDGVQALLWLGLPVLAWLLIARTRKVGVPVGVVLVLGLGAGIVVVSTGALDRGRLELGTGYAVAAAILITVASRSQEEKTASAADLTLRDTTRFFGLTAVLFQAGLAILAALWIFLVVASGADIPPAGDMPAAPAGFTAVGDDDEGCGSGSCTRSRTYAVGPDLSEDVVTKLVRSSGCRPNSWVLDRRDRCIDYRLSGDKLVVSVTLVDRM